MAALLEVRGLTKRFGGVVALDAVSLAVEPGRVCGLIGPNGAGKTTLLNLVSGLDRSDAGDVSLRGTSLARLKPYQRARLGLGRTFQNIRVFKYMTVAENVAAAQYGAQRAGLRDLWPRLGRTRDRQRRAREILAFLKLERRADQCAGDLPYGEQRRVEIARALATDPAVLLLDEPAAGMNEQETEELCGDIELLRAEGYTVLLVEHDMALIRRVSDHLVVLNFGQKIADGPTQDVLAAPAVVEAYLGE